MYPDRILLDRESRFAVPTRTDTGYSATSRYSVLGGPGHATSHKAFTGVERVNYRVAESRNKSIVTMYDNES